MQTLVNDDLEIVVFELRARSDGGTNTFMNGSAYSYLYYGEPLSMGSRMALEIKNGISENRKPIPDVNTDVNKDNNNVLFEKLWKLYPNKKGKGQISDSRMQAERTDLYIH